MIELHQHYIKIIKSMLVSYKIKINIFVTKININK